MFYAMFCCFYNLLSIIMNIIIWNYIIALNTYDHITACKLFVPYRNTWNSVETICIKIVTWKYNFFFFTNDDEN